MLSKAEVAPVGISIHNSVDKPREKCGVVGVYAPGGHALPEAYLALEALQHRGQDGAGFSFPETAPSSETTLRTVKELGRVAGGFDGGRTLESVTEPTYATGHVRYGTTEAQDAHEALHPLESQGANEYTVSHNGQFDMNTLFKISSENGIDPEGTDTEIFTKILDAYVQRHGHIEPAMHQLLPQLEGAFSLTILTDEAIYGVRDRHGVRPLVIGSKDGATMIASEVGGLEAAGFTFDSEVMPGTYVVVNGQGNREERWSKEKKKACIFEAVYLSKPNNVINGVWARDYRYAAGETLGDNETVEADMVVPVLGSAKVYARGYQAASALPYVEALKKNPNRRNPESDRTFIEKTQADRKAAVMDKFVVDIDAVRGKSIILIDDSLVRGTTTSTIIEMLKADGEGAAEVHVRIGSEIYSKPCTFGVNVQSEEELLAHNRTVEEMAAAIGADSLKFVSLKDMHKAAGVSGKDVCDGCMGGSYPKPRKKLEKVPVLASLV